MMGSKKCIELTCALQKNGERRITSLDTPYFQRGHFPRFLDDHQVNLLRNRNKIDFSHFPQFFFCPLSLFKVDDPKDMSERKNEI